MPEETIAVKFISAYNNYI